MEKVRNLSTWGGRCAIDIGKRVFNFFIKHYDGELICFFLDFYSYIYVVI